MGRLLEELGKCLESTCVIISGPSVIVLPIQNTISVGQAFLPVIALSNIEYWCRACATSKQDVCLETSEKRSRKSLATHPVVEVGVHVFSLTTGLPEDA